MNTKRTLLTIFILITATGGGFFLGQLFSGKTADAPGQADSERKVLYWQSPMNPTEIYDQPGKSAMGMDLIPVYEDDTSSQSPSSAASERKVLYWQSPMNPTEIYDSPGKSVMGMDLVPVYEDEAGMGSGGAISIDPITVQNMGVRMGIVTRDDFNRIILTVGKVEFDEELLYIVNTKISGWIEELYVNYEGAEVEIGDPLLEIYSPELVSTQEEYLLAVRNYKRIGDDPSPSVREDAETLLASVRTRLEYWDIPEEEIERLQQTGEIKKTVLLRAPATGVVIDKYVVEGAFIKAGMDLYQIADLRTIWVHASIYDNEIPWISEGQTAEMELSYLPGKSYTGLVTYIYPYLREKARDIHVRLVFQNPNLDLKPGMYANIRLKGKTITDALVIPSEAVILSGQRAVVFVVLGEGKFEPREIRLGEVGGPGNAYYRVLSGLLEGERIVTSAQFLLDSESRLQEVIKKMLEARRQRVEGSSFEDDSDAMLEMDHGVEADSATTMQHGEGPGAMPDMNHSAEPDSTATPHRTR